MISFQNDYSEGACKQVLEAFIKYNEEQNVGYGLDQHSINAANLIRELIHQPNADIHFVPGGTPANVLAISLLRPYEAVVCAKNGHINTHETGAVEATGHKIIEVDATLGKLSAQILEKELAKYTDEHMVKPRMVFLSNPSEYGTIYSKKELAAISKICKKHDLYLYLDGARLGAGLTAKENDLSIQDIASYVDVFYIGGTKNGALLGEAFVILNDQLKPDFRYLLKRNGSMLAKGFTIGIEFEALFTNNLYFEIAKNANEKAQTLRHFLLKNNIQEFIPSCTNQIFFIFENKILKKLEKKYLFSPWEKIDKNHTVVRFVCSFATSDSMIQEFEKDLTKALQ